MRVFLGCLLLVVSCGQDVKHTGGIPTGIEKKDQNESASNTEQVQLDDTGTMLIQEGAEIPPCDKDNKLIYVQAEETFKVCNAGTWSNIDLRGPKGDSEKIVKTIACVGKLEGIGWTASYSAALMSSGDLFVTGQIGNSLFESSATKFFSSQQNGSDTGSILIRFDAIESANGGFWEISLNRDSLVTTVSYNDVELAGGQDTWSMSPDKCVVNDFTTP